MDLFLGRCDYCGGFGDVAMADDRDQAEPALACTDCLADHDLTLTRDRHLR